MYCSATAGTSFFAPMKTRLAASWIFRFTRSSKA